MLDNQVLRVKEEKDENGYHVVEVGCVNHDKPNKVHVNNDEWIFVLLLEHFIIQLQEEWLEFYTDVGIYPKRKIMDFPVSTDALPPIGEIFLLLAVPLYLV